MGGELVDPSLRIGLVGYGEVGKILARALRERGIGWVGAWDVLLRDSSLGAAMKARARDDGVEACASLAALLAGNQAGALAEKLRPLGFDMTVVAEGIGVASAIKLCRSVFIKGLEAIIVESYTLARCHGVERQLLASLTETFPEIDWDKQGTYFFSRVAKHGKRRAEEMREAANTVREAGFDPWMSAASAETQDWVAALSKRGLFHDLSAEAGWRDYADKIIAALEKKGVPTLSATTPQRS